MGVCRVPIKLVTFSGASGAGKSTIVKAQLNWIYSRVTLVLSTTTRELRREDLRGEYEYVSPFRFEELERENAFAWAPREFGGKKYGTRKSVIDAAVQQKEIGLMIITPDTIPELKRYAPEKVYSFYIVTATYPHLLAERMRKRQETEENINRRLQQCASWDQSALGSYDKQIFDEFITNEDNDFGRRAAVYIMKRIQEFVADKTAQ